MAEEIEGLEISLFKYPSDLSRAIELEVPDVLGFSNYSWNIELSYKFASVIKSKYPKCVIVFGGPNYGLTEDEMKQFWERFPNVDFYLILEAEIAFKKPMQSLIANQFDVDSVKANKEHLTNCHFLENGKLEVTSIEPRIKELNTIPSSRIS